MQGLKSASLIKRCLGKSGFVSGYYRSLSSFSSRNALSDDLGNIVLVEGKAWSRTAILNRPSVLNALNTAVGARLRKFYKSWEDNPDIGFVVLKGRGRAFCAGGDIVTLCHLINEGIIGCCCSSTLSSQRNFQTSWLVFESHRGQNMTGKLENSTTSVFHELRSCGLLQSFMNNDINSLVELDVEKGEVFLERLLVNGWLLKLVYACGHVEKSIATWTFGLMLYSSEEVLSTSACDFWTAILSPTSEWILVVGDHLKI